MTQNPCFSSSLFTSHPDIQSTFFPMMSANDIVTLGSHGSKIVLAIGGLVHTVRDDNPEALALKLRMVNQGLIYSEVYRAPLIDGPQVW